MQIGDYSFLLMIGAVFILTIARTDEQAIIIITSNPIIYVRLFTLYPPFLNFTARTASSMTGVNIFMIRIANNMPTGKPERLRITIVTAPNPNNS